MTIVGAAPSGEIVEEAEEMAGSEKRLGRLRTNKPATACDQIAQRASLQGLGIVVAIAGAAMGDGFGILFVFVRNFSRFLRAISVRVRIIAIRIVIVGGAGVHSIENDAEDPALDATQQIAGAG